MTTQNAAMDLTEWVIIKTSAGVSNVAGIGVVLVLLTSCNTPPNNDSSAAYLAPITVACSIPQNSAIRDTPTVYTNDNTCSLPKAHSSPMRTRAYTSEKLIIGEIERVTLEPQGVRYEARIDTGASLTTLHATAISYFERDGEPWVRFNMNHPRADHSVVFEKAVVRKVVIKDTEPSVMKGRNSGERPVIRLTLTLGPISRQVEVSLTNRSHMQYPVLIGRNFLLDSALVDVSRRNSGLQLLATQTTNH